MRMRRKEERGLVDKASARGGKPSKEGDDEAAEAKPWRGGGRCPPPAARRVVRVNNKGFTTISKGDRNDEGSDYGKN
jgi:hypothetical protein